MRLLLTLIAVVAISNAQLRTVDATVINYGNFVGSTVSFNGISENPSFNPTPTTGLYRTPTVMGNMLSFSPLEFEASRNTVGTTTVNSILSGTFTAAPFQLITGVSFELLAGDYAIAVPFAGGSGDIRGSLASTVGLSGPFSSALSALSNTPPGIPAGVLSPLGTFHAIAPTASVAFTLDSSLLARVNASIADSFAKFKEFKITVTTQPDVIPEPTSALIFMGLGLAGIASRRRR